MQPSAGKTLLGIFFTLALVFAVTAFGGNILLKLFHQEESTGLIFWITRFIFWICLGLVWLFAKKVERQPLLPWGNKKYDAWVYPVSAMAIFVALFIGLIIIVLLLTVLGVSREMPKMHHMVQLFEADHALLFFTAITAGVVEELLFRGYLQPRIQFLVKNSWIAIISTAILFGLLHFGYGNLYQVVGPFFIGFVFAIYYNYFRNIGVLIVCHALWDIGALFLSIYKDHMKM